MSPAGSSEARLRVPQDGQGTVSRSGGAQDVPAGLAVVADGLRLFG
jgi:hypothetical protein